MRWNKKAGFTVVSRQCRNPVTQLGQELFIIIIIIIIIFNFF